MCDKSKIGGRHLVNTGQWSWFLPQGFIFKRWWTLMVLQLELVRPPISRKPTLSRPHEARFIDGLLNICSYVHTSDHCTLNGPIYILFAFGEHRLHDLQVRCCCFFLLRETSYFHIFPICCSIWHAKTSCNLNPRSWDAPLRPGMRCYRRWSQRRPVATRCPRGDLAATSWWSYRATIKHGGSGIQ